VLTNYVVVINESDGLARATGWVGIEMGPAPASVEAPNSPLPHQKKEKSRAPKKFDILREFLAGS